MRFYAAKKIRIALTVLAFIVLLTLVANAEGPPPGFRAFKWGSAPRGSIKKFSGPSDGATMYVPVNAKTLAPLFDIPVAEEDYSFFHGRFYSGDAYLDGEVNFHMMKAALIKIFGQPSFANENLKIWKWKWPKSPVEIHLSYQTKFARTTVTFVDTSI